MSRMKEKYYKEILPKLKERYSKRNVMQLPKLKKIVITMGIDAAIKDKTAIQEHKNELALLSSQKPIMTKAKKSISNFKIRKDQELGIKVTLRKKRMYDFLDRFCNIVAPRIRDFRGFNIKTDGLGNFTIGLEDQQAFPEINLDTVKRSQGMHITFVTSAVNQEECIYLFELFKFPIKRRK